MSDGPLPDFEVLCALAQYALFHGLSRKGYRQMAPLTVSTEYFNGEVPTAYVDMMLGSLRDKNLAVRRSDRLGKNIVYEITPLGISQVEQALHAKDSWVRIFSNGGWAQVRQIVEETDGSIESSGDAAAGNGQSDDAWEPLPIDRSAPTYEKMLPSVEEAIRQISADNGYAATQPEERNAILSTLRAGLASLKEEFTTSAVVNALLVRPFQYLVEKFSGAAIGEIAKSAVQHVLKWLSS